jgi:virginiamycin A acetyltransferase
MMLRDLYNRLPLPVKAVYRYARRKLSAVAAVWNADEWKSDPRVSIGKYTYGIRRSRFPILTAGTRIDIGKYCSIAQHVLFVVGRHPTEYVSTFPFRAKFVRGGRADDEEVIPELITIGNDVWIGTRATIMANVCVGHGAVVAAGSVVVKDVPPYAVVAGVPAKTVKMRFDDEQVKKLLAIAWWDWPEERVRANMELFYGNVDTFIEKHYPDCTADSL